MKTFLAIVSLAALGGCAVPPPAPAYYGTRLPEPADPSQWHVVSVTPVAPGTGARVAGSSGSSVQYTSEPATVTQPVYVAQPVYVPQPYYAYPEPYYTYPPVSIDLGFGFGFGRGWGGGWGGHRGHHGGGHRNWAGVGIGSHWHR